MVLSIYIWNSFLQHDTYIKKQIMILGKEKTQGVWEYR